ncbi:MAG: hypothetical protein ACXV2I_01540 [Actinomycetes bacterium]
MSARTAAAAAAKPVSASSVSPVSKASRPAGTRPAPSRPRLSLVPPMSADAPRAPFVVLVACLLVAGLGGLLFLHTALAEDSFRLHDLQVRSALLDDQEQALEQQIALEASPQRLAARARTLGMVRSENPAFIRLSDGRILGQPKAGVAPPPPPAPTASPSASSAASPAPSSSGSPTGTASPKPSPTGSAD